MLCSAPPCYDRVLTAGVPCNAMLAPVVSCPGLPVGWGLLARANASSFHQPLLEPWPRAPLQRLSVVGHPTRGLLACPRPAKREHSPTSPAGLFLPLPMSRHFLPCRLSQLATLCAAAQGVLVQMPEPIQVVHPQRSLHHPCTRFTVVSVAILYAIWKL
jgi:hypothetical protein